MKYLARSLFSLGLSGLILTLGACDLFKSTGPGDGPTVEVGFTASTGCGNVTTPYGSLNMGIIEFENISNSYQIVPRQVAVVLTAKSAASVNMYDFGGIWYKLDGSTIPNTSSQQDSEGTYITFDAIPEVSPYGVWTAHLIGGGEDVPPGTYTFSILKDSVKVRTPDGKRVPITWTQTDLVMTIKAAGVACP